MIEEENLDVRTITLGISLMDCIDSDLDRLNEKIYKKITTLAKDLVSTGEKIESEFGIPIVNKRISITPVALVGGSACKKPEDFVTIAEENNKQGKEYCKTKNVIKKEKLLLILNHRLTNIRHDHLHHITSEIVKREPSFICIEDLNVKGMMKNRHLSKAVQQQGFYEFRRQMEYKSKWNNIQVFIADRFFPSSKLCSCCGKIKKDLKLSERIYKCECGNVVDRDLQAALNLKKYGEDVLKRSVA